MQRIGPQLLDYERLPDASGDHDERASCDGVWHRFGAKCRITVVDEHVSARVQDRHEHGGEGQDP